MENRINENNEVKGRCVYAAPIARALVHKNYRIIDVKPNKENSDKTVFVFEETDDFNADFECALNDYKKKKEQKRLNRLARETFVNNGNDSE